MIAIAKISIWWLIANLLTSILIAQLPWPQDSIWPTVVVVLLNTFYTVVATLFSIEHRLKVLKNKV